MTTLTKSCPESVSTLEGMAAVVIPLPRPSCPRLELPQTQRDPSSPMAAEMAPDANAA